MFNKQFSHIDKICDIDAMYESKMGPSQNTDGIVFKNIQCKKIPSLSLGLVREKIKEEAMIEAAYETNGEEKLKESEEIAEIDTGKGLLHLFGYKHKKAIKFYGQLLKCLKDCYEQKFEQLNIDMNFFLLLKNELSLHFLRNTENVVSTLKSAIRIHAAEDEKDRVADE